MRILIDTNVILDIFQKRKPFFPDSYRALRKAIEAKSECLVSASSATDIFYLLRKFLKSADQAKERIAQLSQIVIFADFQPPNKILRPDLRPQHFIQLPC